MPDRSQRHADPGRPVARLVSPVVGRMAAMVLLAVVVCCVGVLASGAAVQRVPDEVEPLATAHERLTVAVADLDSATSAWALSGDPGARRAYDEARAAVKGAALDLQRRAAGTDAAPLAGQEVEDVERWVDGWADPVSARPAGAVVPAEQYAVGLTARASWGRSRDETAAAVTAEVDRATAAATLRLRLTIIASAMLLVGAAVVITRARAQLLAEMSEPLLDLERVVQRMLRNDPEGRAAADRGPKEVRSIARALNDFADAGSRARAVEGRFQGELHVLDRAKDDFVSNVSHELRTPLTTISGYLEMVADEFEGRLEPRHHRMLEATRRNVVRLRALIDDLLALSKAENRPSELEPFDITEIVVDAVTDVRMTAARRAVNIEVSAPGGPMPVVCDRAMLYRAFLNVLSNAVKFSHDGGAVEVSVTRVLHRVEVTVRDHGIGIPRAELDRLGTRFFRASNAMTHEIAGTGLGLRIVQTIIDEHAGDVVIESAEGAGTTVFVRLRLHGERVGRLPAVPDAVPADGEPAGTRGPAPELS